MSKKTHRLTTSIRMLDVNGDTHTTMTVSLETHGQCVRPEGWVHIAVEGDIHSPGAKSKRQRPFEISVGDEQVLALAQMLNDYVEQRRFLPAS